MIHQTSALWVALDNRQEESVTGGIKNYTELNETITITEGGTGNGDGTLQIFSRLLNFGYLVEALFDVGGGFGETPFRPTNTRPFT